MVKLLLCIFSAAGIAAIMLQLRQQHVELEYQSNQFHNKIEEAQARLWNQQFQIGTATAAPAVAEAAKALGTNLVPNRPALPHAPHTAEAANTGE